MHGLKFGHVTCRIAAMLHRKHLKEDICRGLGEENEVKDKNAMKIK